MYKEEYYSDYLDNSISVLLECQVRFPSIDVGWFFAFYMKSEIRRSADSGRARYLCMESCRVLDWLGELYGLDEIDYPKSNNSVDFYGDILVWIIMQWSDLSFRYDIYSKDLIDLISFDDMVRAYRVGHERGFRAESENLYNRFIKDKV